VKALLAASAALATALCGLGLVAVLVGATGPGVPCAEGASPLSAAGQPGSWLSTSYGPPWGGIEGDGVTATGVDLRSGPARLEIAVDPSVIPLGSWVYVQPNPFGTAQPFYAGDTGSAIRGQHIDIYDWRGRPSQQAWGARPVTVTPAPPPGSSATCSEAPESATGENAVILSDGRALAPADAPSAVRLAIAAGNLIRSLPYPAPDVHYGSLARLWPAYDCSGAVSFVLYGAGLLGTSALDSTGLESYGLPGPGRWITIYANPAHTWIVVAGIALDTASYGGPSVPTGSGPRWRKEPLANLNDGTRYAARHPAGL
jgi:3D (Asp-Asp-Asp) domain-containing protein